MWGFWIVAAAGAVVSMLWMAGFFLWVLVGENPAGRTTLMTWLRAAFVHGSGGPHSGLVWASACLSAFFVGIAATAMFIALRRRMRPDTALVPSDAPLAPQVMVGVVVHLHECKRGQPSGLSVDANAHVVDVKEKER